MWFLSIRRRLALTICPELEPAHVTVVGCDFGVPPERSALITIARTYGEHLGLKLSTVSTYALKDGKILPDIEKGKRDLTTTRARGAIQWFSDHWPTDLEWPKGIDRPTKTKGAA